MNRITDLIFLAAAIVAIGLLTGWLVGASSTPVVSALLPLVAGLLGVVFFYSREHRAMVRQLVEAVGMLDNELKQIAVNVIADSTIASRQMATIWALGVISFSASIYCGIHLGRGHRERIYPSVAELVNDSSVLGEIDGSTYGELEFLRSHLANRVLSERELTDIFESCVVRAIPYIRGAAEKEILYDGKDGMYSGVLLQHVIHELTGRKDTLSPAGPPNSQDSSLDDLRRRVDRIEREIWPPAPPAPIVDPSA